jgi:hypothetical protein
LLELELTESLTLNDDARATVAHAVYGIATAVLYEGLKAYFSPDVTTEN